MPFSQPLDGERIGEWRSMKGSAPSIHAAHAGGGLPLGNNRRFASGATSSGSTSESGGAAAARAKRYKLQEVAGKLMPGESVAFCCRRVKGAVSVYHRPGDTESAGKAFYKGLLVCGSVWTCPVCAAKITERRRQELARAMSLWWGSVFMVTFTLQHGREDSLKELRDCLREGYRKLKSGRWYQEFKQQHHIKGAISAMEMTISLENGWHPHLHVMFFADCSPEDLDQAAIEGELSQRFGDALDRLGRYVSPVHGVKVSAPVVGASDPNTYIGKWGLESELAKAPTKSGKLDGGIRHYSVWELLELAGHGEHWAAAKFREYAQTMKGSKQLVWSKGLKQLIGITDEEKTDQELATESVETGDELMTILTANEWGQVCKLRKRAELLEVADEGNVEKLIDWLSDLGIGLEPFRSG